MEPQVMARAFQPLPERRYNQVLRERFDAALILLKPLLGRPETVTGSDLYRAMSRLQTTYPDLSASEIEALVTAVVRNFQSRQP